MFLLFHFLTFHRTMFIFIRKHLEKDQDEMMRENYKYKEKNGNILK